MITETQAAKRAKGIGSSEAAAILGEDPYRTAADVRADKLGLIERPDIGSEINSPAWLGNHLEQSILSMASEAIGEKIHRKNTERVHPEHKMLRANLDAWVTPERLVEAKSVGILSRYVGEEWGEPGTDEIPTRVNIQVHHQMTVTGAKYAHVVALLSGRGLVVYNVPRSDQLCELMAETLSEWWTRHVVAGEKCPESYSDETLAALPRIEGKSVEVAPDLVAAYTAAREAVKEAEERKKEASAALRTALGDAEIGECPGWRAKYAQRTRRGVDMPALKAAHPEIVKQFEKATTFRALDVRARKAQ